MAAPSLSSKLKPTPKLLSAALTRDTAFYAHDFVFFVFDLCGPEDHTDRTPQLSLTHSLFFTLKITLITPPPPPPPPPPHLPSLLKGLSCQPASSAANVSPSIAPGVIMPIATKVCLALRHVFRLTSHPV
ncbi:hypothetical protein E2C01_051113 [Portunus trituberculatus]|uniref:Uncharacterized protein n=1 Tax=Portunus trituberculatus TaxID=210409 RepID=A0A5B7GHU0_PORTR|nr:hypothetical protein [Portunus trituberculatus]